jgi:geranylgeranyl diphosphate synthase type I
VPEVLQRAQELTAPAIEKALGRLSPEVRPIAEYHFGLMDERGRRVRDTPSGKGIRPALAVLSAEAAGASGYIGVPAAVAVELVHNFSLVHDDVIDCDRERRHRPTVWTLWGVGRAIIAGDAMLALAQTTALEAAGVERAAAAALCLAEATGRMIAGQALDMAFESVDGVDPERCLAMEAGKTGALLGCAACLGSILAGAPEGVTSALREFGAQLGLAFQAVDDLLGIWGNPSQTGKPMWSDLRQHKKTLPIAMALSGGGPEADELSALLAARQLTDVELARAAALLDRSGARAAAMDEANSRLSAALEALEHPSLSRRAKDELADVARFVVTREY